MAEVTLFQYEAESRLTKRDIFAAMAMQGLLVNFGEGLGPGVIASDAVEYADALLAKLEQADK